MDTLQSVRKRTCCLSASRSNCTSDPSCFFLVCAILEQPIQPSEGGLNLHRSHHVDLERCSQGQSYYIVGLRPVWAPWDPVSKSIEGLSPAGKDLLPGLTSESSPQDLDGEGESRLLQATLWPSHVHTCTPPAHACSESTQTHMLRDSCSKLKRPFHRFCWDLSYEHRCFI